jgi:hypothetical protein
MGPTPNLETVTVFYYFYILSYILSIDDTMDTFVELSKSISMLK